MKQPISEANLYGILYCLLQLLNLSEEWKSRVVDPRNPILPHVPFLHDLASKWYRALFCVCVVCRVRACVRTYTTLMHRMHAYRYRRRTGQTSGRWCASTSAATSNSRWPATSCPRTRLSSQRTVLDS